jgi:ADP-ribosyl-[dinitrogen reductase] hydrolase
MKGSCHCKTVQYEVTKLDQPFAHCHCQTCQKTQGAPFSSSVRVAPEDFKFTAGEDQVKDYYSSPDKARRFCSNCGCHIVAIKEGQPNWILRAATLDEDPGIRPSFHIWCEHDRDWLTLDAPRHDQFPA